MVATLPVPMVITNLHVITHTGNRSRHEGSVLAHSQRWRHVAPKLGLQAALAVENGLVCSPGGSKVPREQPQTIQEANHWGVPRAKK